MESRKTYYELNKEKFISYYNKRKLIRTVCEFCGGKDYINIASHNLSMKHIRNTETK